MRRIVALVVVAACGGSPASPDAQLDPADSSVDAQDPSVATVTVTATPMTAPADGTTAVQLLVHVANKDGGALANRAVTLSTPALGVTLAPTAGTTDASGNLMATATSTRMGAKPITAEVDGVMGMVSVPFGAPACASRLELSGPARSAWGAASEEVAAFDMNGDGRPDLVALDQSASTPTLQIGLGQGDGRFAAPVSIAAGTGARRVVGGDFDGDGDIDLAAVTTAGLVMFVGNGDGTVTTGSTIAGGPANPIDLVVGRFNSDAHLDLAVSTSDAAAPVSILLGNGDRSFAAGAPITNGAIAEGLAVALLGSDTNLDLVTASTSGVVTSYAGNGDGTFATGVPVTAGVVSQLATADVNGDSHVDVVAVSPTAHQLSIHLGAGDGTLGAAITVASPGRPRDVMLLDLDGIAGAEIVTVNVDVDLARVVRHVGSNQFAATGAFDTGKTVRAGVAADVDGDGRGDVVTGHAQDTVVTTLRGDGIGGFRGPLSRAAVGEPAWVAIGDVDRDGKPDVVAALNNSFELVVLKGAGDGTYTSKTTYALGSYPREGALADLDGDGWIDVVVTLSGANQVAIARNNGDGTFAGVVTYPTGGGPLSVAVAHLDGDTILDLAVANNNSSSITVLRGMGNATFTPLASPLSVSPGVYTNRVVAGDFDNDGDSDLAFSTSGTGIQTSSRIVGFYRNNGDATFAALTYTVGAFALETVTAAHLDGDGKLDLVSGLWSGGAVTVMRGNGDGTFQAGVTYGLGRSSYRIAVGDLDSDGDADLVVGDQRASEVRVLRGQGDATFGPSERFVGPVAVDVAIGDLDGDERPDLVTADFTDSIGTRLSGGCR